jgi:hypothetical protein
MRRRTRAGAEQGVRGQEATGQAAPPTAVRQGRARLGDLRLWLGVLLLLGSTAAGFLLLAGGEDTVTVWRATRDLAPGSAPTALEAVAVSRDVAGDRYAGPAGEPVGRLRWPIGEGGLVPIEALDEGPWESTRQVTVPVDPLHAPVALQAGDIVDMWSMPRPDAIAGAVGGLEPTLVLPAAVVASVAEDALGLGGEVGVVLEVPTDSVPSVVAAARTGVVDLVAVPATSPELMP